MDYGDYMINIWLIYGEYMDTVIYGSLKKTIGKP